MKELILAGLMSLKMASKPFSYKRKHKFEARTHTHIIIFAAILLYIVSKKNALIYKQIAACQEPRCPILLQICKPVYTMTLKRKRASCQQNHVTAIIFLLLVNDIHPNPGPKALGTP